MRLACVLVAALALASPALAAPAAAPPTVDPCARDGRDTCGTAGVGLYRTYRYGTRWFGDFRGAVDARTPTFCIDLRLWYASPAYRYRPLRAGLLRNKLGQVVPTENVRRMAYAIFAFGRSASARRQAAVMMYVHAQMGDARPGEVAPDVVDAATARLYRTVAAAAERFHGPYRVATRFSAPPTVGSRVTAALRVLSASGRAVPYVRLTVAATGAAGAPRSATTGSDGVARVPLTPTTASGLRLAIATEPLAAPTPLVYAPTSDAAKGRGQRLAAPRSQRVTASVAKAVRARAELSTAVSADRIAAGGTATDRVTVTGVPAGWRGPITVRIHGPFRTRDAIVCTGRPAWEGSLRANGPGVYETPPATLRQPGWYAFRALVPAAQGQRAVEAPCAPASETFRVEAKPAVSTSISAQTIRPGTAIFDRVFVSGLAGESATVEAALYGPFASREAISCSGTPAWTGSIAVRGDGQYETQPFTPRVPGFYTYRERIRAGSFVREVESSCGEAAETTVLAARPRLTTRVHRQQTEAGGVVTDTVVVSGLGATSVPVRVELWGPFASRAQVRCTGVPYWTGTFTAAGDGTYTTAPARLERAGYYTYRESISATELATGVTTPCGAATETTLERARPTLGTVVSAKVVRSGTRVSDLVRVQGGRGAAVEVRAELFGPFPSRAAIRCTGKPVWEGSLSIRGDRAASTPRVPLARAGFYAFREHVVASPVVAPSTTACALADETSLATPQIVTGRNDVARYVPAHGAGSAAPVRIRIPSIDVEAPVAPVAIDVASGVLGVPDSIDRTGWWRDGAAPGAASGAVLVAGHVDDARRGAGAFFSLPRLRAGDEIELRTAGGRTVAYRVASVRAYPKSALPTSVYSTSGPPRLVLVTCGGPFDAATRHYTENIVVTATPA